jgi:type I site-specific restriction-modification system R (restriction) subunit
MTPGLAAPPLVLVAPDWADMPTDTQQVLAPLGPEWNQIESKSRLKWLQIAARYPKMSKDAQERVQQRMKDWASLTPEQRKAARANYANVRNASPEQREALKQMWSEYQALPPEEKERLKQTANKAPAQKTAPAIGGQGSTPKAAATP